MGCKYACTCGGNCLNCSSYAEEQYCGEAEDLLARQLGYKDFDDHMNQNREQRDNRERG